MKVSAKGRYALAAMTYLAQKHSADTPITVLTLAEKLGISKIYLEQVFSLLKKAGVVISIKGARGGYQLSAPPNKINIYRILSATDFSLFEQTEDTVAKLAPSIERSMRSRVFDCVDSTLKSALSAISLADIVEETAKHAEENALMYFI